MLGVTLGTVGIVSKNSVLLQPTHFKMRKRASEKLGDDTCWSREVGILRHGYDLSMTPEPTDTYKIKLTWWHAYNLSAGRWAQVDPEALQPASRA